MAKELRQYKQTTEPVAYMQHFRFLLFPPHVVMYAPVRLWQTFIPCCVLLLSDARIQSLLRCLAAFIPATFRLSLSYLILVSLYVRFSSRKSFSMYGDVTPTVPFIFALISSCDCYCHYHTMPEAVFYAKTRFFRDRLLS